AREHSLLLHMVHGLLQKDRFAAAFVHTHVQRPREAFFANLGHLLEATRTAGIRLIVATQQALSGAVPDEEMAGVTYAEEVARVSAKLRRVGGLSAAEMAFLAHSGLMEELRSWAVANNVPLVDGIATLDRNRDQLATWVHLRPRGNRLLAEAFASAIAGLACSAQRS
ncbi:MAG TPA: hypothetical protein VMN03_01895, partial [Burkholderiales bacterium]|nr:hypothetical protein [Burkholderiales bacterium]